MVYVIYRCYFCVNYQEYHGAVAHLARAPRLHRGGKGFDSLQLHHHKTDFSQESLFFVIKVQ